MNYQNSLILHYKFIFLVVVFGLFGEYTPNVQPNSTFIKFRVQQGKKEIKPDNTDFKISIVVKTDTIKDIYYHKYYTKPSKHEVGFYDFPWGIYNNHDFLILIRKKTETDSEQMQVKIHNAAGNMIIDPILFTPGAYEFDAEKYVTDSLELKHHDCYDLTPPEWKEKRKKV